MAKLNKLKKLISDASEHLPWDKEVRLIDPVSNGEMKLAIYPDGRVSTLELYVPDEFRKQGIGSSLQRAAIEEFPNMMGQVSSRTAAKSAYNLGRRPVSNPDASLDDTYKIMDEWSSVNMQRPKASKAVAASGILTGAAKANPIDELRAAERDFGLSDIEKLRASEREFVEPNYNQAKLYDEANTLWQNTGQTLKNIGAPDLAVDLFTPTFESSRDKAMGDKSTMTNVFAALEKLDPTAYAGLLGALAKRGMN